MIANVKVAIVKSCYNRFKGSGIHCVLMLYKSKLKARLVMEFSYAMLTNQTDKFRRKKKKKKDERTLLSFIQHNTCY